MTTDEPSIYADYPSEYRAIAEEQRQHVRAACAGTAALRVQLPQALAEYERDSLALLQIVIRQQENQSRRVYSAGFIQDEVQAQLEYVADLACKNAATRIENAEYRAMLAWNGRLDGLRRTQRMAGVFGAPLGTQQ